MCTYTCTRVCWNDAGDGDEAREFLDFRWPLLLGPLCAVFFFFFLFFVARPPCVFDRKFHEPPTGTDFSRIRRTWLNYSKYRVPFARSIFQNARFFDSSVYGLVTVSFFFLIENREIRAFWGQPVRAQYLRKIPLRSYPGKFDLPVHGARVEVFRFYFYFFFPRDAKKFLENSFIENRQRATWPTRSAPPRTLGDTRIN